MIRRLFVEHPAGVGETYLQHFAVAARFGARMLAGGAGAMIHAVIPGLCQTTASRTVSTLHAELVAKRAATRAAQTQLRTVEYII